MLIGMQQNLNRSFIINIIRILSYRPMGCLHFPIIIFKSVYMVFVTILNFTCNHYINYEQIHKQKYLN
jgi:hypothetical protein